MNCIIQKYSLSILIAFAMLVVVSCQKGGEPVPSIDNDNIVSTSETLSSQRFGNEDVDDEVDAPEVGGNDGDNGGTGNGGTGVGNIVVGGDDNEDDDDNGVIVGGNGGGRGVSGGDLGDDEDQPLGNDGN